MYVKIKTLLTIALVAIAFLAVSSQAATVTIGTTPPTVDATDESNLTFQSGTLKWFSDIEHDAGQTFTPSGNFTLNAFTIRLGKPNQDDGPDWLNLRLGIIERPGAQFIFTDIYAEVAYFGADQAQDDYITFAFDTPQVLTGGVEYGIILDAQAMGDWHNGIPYLSLGGSSYAGGNAIGRGKPRNDDLVFHADLVEGDALEIPDVTGQPQATAEANLDAAGFITGDVTTDYSDTLAAGYVISYSPTGHAVVDTPIDLVVSVGFPIIPDVTGQDQAIAEYNITTAGFTVGLVTTANNKVVPADYVISQDVIGAAPSYTLVNLVVSLGELNAPCIKGDIDGNCVVNIFDLALLAGQWLDARDPFIESGGLVVIEAEHYVVNSPGSDRMWVAKSIVSSTGDGCVQALPDFGANINTDIETTSPHLSYEIDFTTTGTYYLWARGMADNAGSDTIHYGVDGVAVSSGGGDSIQVNTGSFAWSNSNGAAINISSAGMHTLDVWMREDGVIIDRLLLTTNSGYTPVQPVESDSTTEMTADIDGFGGVDMADYAIISQNWQDSYSPVIINEIMASNTGTLPLGTGDILDADGDSSDWIEIYNRSKETVDMTGWYLTDKATELTKWQFTAGPVLESGEHAIIFASGKIGSSYTKHTNFELSPGGEYLGLIFPDLSVAYEYSEKYPEQLADVSYGLFGDELRYFANPTPGTPNNSGYFGLVPDTKFSIDRGFYDADFDVVITCDDPDATIRYTTNSENPTDTFGTIYNGPITISGTTVLKTTASRQGWISSNVDTQTYIFVSDVKSQSLDGSAPGANWPAATTNGQYMNYGMDPEVVVDNPTYAAQIEGSLLSLPSISISTNSTNLFGGSGIYSNASQDGIAWERPASMELINPDGSEGFQIDMGLRIRGGWSRMGQNPKHAFRCFFRAEYGDSKLKFPLFGAEGVDEFDKVDLRCAQNYSWAFCGDAKSTFCHELFARDTQGAMGEPYTRSRYYHLYLNGHYWGLFMTQERSEARYAKSYMGGEVEDYDVLKAEAIVYQMQVTDGDDDWTTNAYNRIFEAAVRDADNVRTGFADNADYFAVQGKNPSGIEDPAFEKLLDLENTIAYMLMCYYFGGMDFPMGLKSDTQLLVNNLFAIYNRNNPDGWKFFIHDAEHAFNLNNSNTDRTKFLDFDGSANYNEAVYFNPVRLHQELCANVEYKIAFADEVYKHFFNGGALSESECFDRLNERLAEVDGAIVAESARWGDAKKGCKSIADATRTPLTRANWDTAIVNLNSWMTGRTNKVFNWIKYRSELGYPSIVPPVLKINGSTQYGGYISVPDTLTLTNPNSSSTIYYTLDGSDPRAIGGAVSGAATSGGSAVALNKTTHVKARVLSGSTWSALADAVFADDRIADSLRITELMYHPTDPTPPEIATVNPDPIDEDFEYIELKNISGEDVNLNLAHFTDGIDFTFGDYTLAAGGFAIIVKNQDAFQTRYPGVSTSLIAGTYTGALDNGGEEIVLRDAAAAEIHDFDYKDGWYDMTDGGGFSLTIRNADATDLNLWDEKAGWRLSAEVDGSPGTDDTGLIPELGDVVINEILAHSDAYPNDWIELYNTTSSAINIGGWFLSDSNVDKYKYEIAADTWIEAGDYLVFTQDDDFGGAFALSENGETLYLRSPAGTGYIEEESFGASASEVAFGRYQKSTGAFNFVAMSSNTPGAGYQGTANAYPKVGPIVINEIMYNPQTNAEAEYVELLNFSGSSVTLYDSLTNVPWKITDGIEYTFPSDSPLTIPAGGYYLLVKDIDAFTAEYGAPTCGWAEWTSGKLNDDGEKVEISMPGDVDGSERQYIRVDRVNYDNGLGEDPWPTSANGLGDSLQRKVADEYGNDVINWQAAGETPGTVNP